MAVVMCAAITFSGEISAAKQLYDQHDRKAIETWVANYYKSLSSQQKQAILAISKANLKMLETSKIALQHHSAKELFTPAELKRLMQFWTQSGELIKDQGALEVLDVACALNALTQLRLNWFKKIVTTYQKEPGMMENIGAYFTEKGKYKLYRELNMLFKSTKEIIEQCMLFEQELLKSF